MDHITIPPKIHYIWFGGNPKGELMLRCIYSWRRFFPGYEIVEWNETNYDINKCDYIREAYAAKKWAFASDYARFDIVNNHGGIYLDTDVEFLKPLPEEMLQHMAFTGYESAGNVSPGLIYAAVPGFHITQEILAKYESRHCVPGEKMQFVTVNMVSTEILEQHTKLHKDEYQVVDHLALYPSTFFCGYDLDVGEYDIRPETICVHHYAGTWTKKTWKNHLQAFVKKAFGISVNRKLIALKRRCFGISADYLK